MKKLITVIFLLFIITSSFAQFKIRDSNLKCIKTKGIVSLISEPVYVASNEQNNPKFIFGTATVAGIALPYIFKYGNSILTKATSKKVEDYTFEIEALNPQAINFSNLQDSLAVIKIENHFYLKGAIEKQSMATYDFDFSVTDNFLTVTLSNITENFTPVKIHKNYDFVLSNFDISINALIKQELEDKLPAQQKIIDLGTVSIHTVNPSFRLEEAKAEAQNQAQFFLPALTEKGEKIEILALIVKLKQKHINPHGTTSSYLNEFLKTNSETNESLLNRIFVKKDETDSE